MKHVHNTCEFGHSTSNPVPLFREILKKSPCCLKIKAWQLSAWVGFVQRKKNVKNQTNFKQATVLLASDTSWKCSIPHPGPAMCRLLNRYATSTLFTRRGFWSLWCSDSDGIWQPQLCCKEFRDPKIDFFFPLNLKARVPLSYEVTGTSICRHLVPASSCVAEPPEEENKPAHLLLVRPGKQL